MSEILSSEWVDRWVSEVAHDKELSHIGKLSCFVVKLVVEGRTIALIFERGVFRNISIIPDSSCDVVEFSGSREAWEKLFKVIPEPLYNDFLAMEKTHPDFAMVSDRICLLRHLRVLLKLFSIAPRRG